MKLMEGGIKQSQKKEAENAHKQLRFTSFNFFRRTYWGRREIPSFYWGLVALSSLAASLPTFECVKQVRAEGSILRLGNARHRRIIFVHFLNSHRNPK